MDKTSERAASRRLMESAFLSGLRGSTHDERSTLAAGSTLGYKEGMITETRPAPQWRIPIADYTRHLRARRQSEKTIYLRSYHLRVMSNAFRSRSPFSLLPADVEDFLSILSAHLKRNTQRSFLTSIRGFFRWALQHSMIQSNPCEFIDAIKPEKGIPRPADWETVRRAIDDAPERVRLMIQIAATTGLRAFEIAAVHRDHVFRDAGGYVLSVPRGKGEKPRNVPLLPIVASKILEAETWVFPSQKRGLNGNHIQGKRVTELVSDALPPGVTAHKLRHTFATTHYAEERDLLALQKLLGHASVATTEIYTEVPMDAMRRGVSKLAAYL